MRQQWDLPMRNRLRLAMLLPFLLIFLGQITPTHAEELDIKGVKVPLPEGREWVRETGRNGTTLQRKWEISEAEDRHEPAVAMIQILPLAESDGFADNFKMVTGIFPELKEEDPYVESEGKTVNGYDMRMDYRCCAYRQDVRINATTVGIGDGNRQFFAVLIGMNLDDEDEDWAEAEFETMMRNVRMRDGDKPFELTPPSGAGGLEGAYTTLTNQLMPNIYGGLDFTSESEVLVFDKSGLYADQIPSGTMPEHCTANPTDCGTYVLNGGGLFSGPKSITMSAVSNSYGILETDEHSFGRDGNNLVIDEAEYRMLDPMPSGTPFEGKWRYFFASSGTTATSSGGISVERMLTLNKDGTFTRTGGSSLMSSMEVGSTSTTVAGGNERPLEKGTYRTEGYHLILAGNGREERLSIFMPDKGSDEILVIDGNNYLKEDQ